MLDHLRQRVIDLLAPVTSVTLSTYGPAGIQAQVLPSVALGTRLFILIPSTSDHLLNLEQEPTVVATTTNWQLLGQGQLLPAGTMPVTLPPSYASHHDDYIIVEIMPTRLQIGRPNGGGFIETIDFTEKSPLSM